MSEEECSYMQGAQLPAVAHDVILAPTSIIKAHDQTHYHTCHNPAIDFVWFKAWSGVQCMYVVRWEFETTTPFSWVVQAWLLASIYRVVQENVAWKIRQSKSMPILSTICSGDFKVWHIPHGSSLTSSSITGSNPSANVVIIVLEIIACQALPVTALEDVIPVLRGALAKAATIGSLTFTFLMLPTLCVTWGSASAR
jgi:hypothetical protein